LAIGVRAIGVTGYWGQTLKLEITFLSCFPASGFSLINLSTYEKGANLPLTFSIY